MFSKEAIAFERWQSRPGPEELEALLRASRDVAFAISLEVLQNRHDAEDSCQKALIKVAEHVRGMESAEHYRNWLYATSLTTALNVRRSRVRRKDLERRWALEKGAAQAGSADPSPDRLWDRVSELDVDLRCLVVDHYLVGNSLRTIARAKGCSAVAVWKNLRKARRALREALAGADGIPLLAAGPLLGPRSTVPLPGTGSSRLMDAVMNLGGVVMKGKVLAALAALLLLVLGTATLRSLFSGGSPAPREARARTLVPAAAKEPGAAAGARVGVPAEPVPAPRAAAERPREADEEGTTLLAGLVKFRELLLARGGRSDAGDVCERLNRAWKRLGGQVVSDPETFIAFLREPESEPVFVALLGLLYNRCSFGEGSDSHERLAVTRFPEPLLAGLEGILSSGTRSQKLALLEALKMTDCDRRLLEASRSLLFQSDPELQAAVLLAASGNVSWTEERAELLRDVWQASADLRVRGACLYALSESKRAAVNDLFLDCAQDFVRARGANAAGCSMENLLNVTMHANLTRENEGRYADLLGLLLRSSPQPGSYEELVHATLQLSPKRAAPLLEEALALAPEKALKDRIDRALRRVRAGEVRSSELEEAFSDDGSP
jgi:RNA polymerase sigma factor (sigma-70 family)